MDRSSLAGAVVFPADGVPVIGFFLIESMCKFLAVTLLQTYGVYYEYFILEALPNSYV